MAYSKTQRLGDQLAAEIMVKMVRLSQARPNLTRQQCYEQVVQKMAA